jgi:hypothetical protein
MLYGYVDSGETGVRLDLEGFVQAIAAVLSPAMLLRNSVDRLCL